MDKLHYKVSDKVTNISSIPVDTLSHIKKHKTLHAEITGSDIIDGFGNIVKLVEQLGLNLFNLTLELSTPYRNFSSMYEVPELRENYNQLLEKAVLFTKKTWIKVDIKHVVDSTKEEFNEHGALQYLKEILNDIQGTNVWILIENREEVEWLFRQVDRDPHLKG